jgi:hypothetical protein
MKNSFEYYGRMVSYALPRPGGGAALRNKARPAVLLGRVSNVAPVRFEPGFA